MAEFEDLLAKLPAPNSEEPVSLRQDILDELQDHLQCAAAREAVSHSDPAEVEQSVLARFGNPRQIARKLWFDAMKEKLLMQKLTLALVSIVALASATACGLMWSLARDFQAANSELLSQSREVNEELLAQFQTLTNRKVEEPNLMNWVPLQVQVNKNDDERTPGAGFSVVLHGHAISEAEKATLKEMTDESGRADFGIVRPGSYSLSVETPWSESYSDNIIVKPGSPDIKTVLAPAKPPEAHLVKPLVEWPKELEGMDVAALINIHRSNETRIGNATWKSSGSNYLLIRPDGRLAVYSALVETVPQNNPSRAKNDRYTFKRTHRIDSKPEVYEELIPWRGNTARLRDIKLVKLAQEADFPSVGDFLDLHFLEILDPAFGKRHSYDVTFYVQAESNPPEKKIQVWPINLSFEAEVDFSHLMAAVEKFPQYPPAYMAEAFGKFSAADKDNNLEISGERETRILAFSLNRDGEVWARLDPEQFPLSFERFLKHWVEYREED